MAVSTVILHYDVTSGGGRGEDKPKFGPNLNEFVRRFDAATTNGQGELVCIEHLYDIMLNCFVLNLSYGLICMHVGTKMFGKGTNTDSL